MTAALSLPQTLRHYREYARVGFVNILAFRLRYYTGVVTYDVPGRYFRATVDAFSSSSGSGVFDAEGALVGILQRGHDDYVPRGDCRVVNVIDDSAGGEIVGYPHDAMEEHCAREPASSACSCDGPCRVTTDASISDDVTLDAGLPSTDVGEPDAFVEAPMASSGCAASGPSTSWVWALMLFARNRRRRAER